MIVSKLKKKPTEYIRYLQERNKSNKRDSSFDENNQEKEFVVHFSGANTERVIKKKQSMLRFKSPGMRKRWEFSERSPKVEDVIKRRIVSTEELAIRIKKLPICNQEEILRMVEEYELSMH